MADLTTSPMAGGYTFLEAPRWHEGRLWCVDFFTNRVLSFDQQGEEHLEAEIPGIPSGIGFLPDGDLLVVSQFDHKVLRCSGSRISEHADLTRISVGATNDMIVDADGDAYVGNWGFNLAAGGAPEPARLALVRVDGSVSVVAEDLIFPNGMILTEDGSTLLVAESFANRITAFDVGANKALSGRRIWADLGEPYTPDGICLDSNGGVWAGNPLVGKFIHISADGEIVDEIDCGDRWAVACVLGGPERTTLYTLQAETTMEDQPKGISSAFIETVIVDAPGAGRP